MPTPVCACMCQYDLTTFFETQRLSIERQIQLPISTGTLSSTDPQMNSTSHCKSYPRNIFHLCKIVTSFTLTFKCETQQLSQKPQTKYNVILRINSFLYVKSQFLTQLLILLIFSCLAFHLYLNFSVRLLLRGKFQVFHIFFLTLSFSLVSSLSIQLFCV